MWRRPPTPARAATVIRSPSVPHPFPTITTPASPAVTALGYAAASLTTLSLFPQAIKTLRGGDLAGVSLRMYLLFTVGIGGWALYGLLIGNGPVLVANLVALVPSTLVLDRKIRSLLRR